MIGQTGWVAGNQGGVVTGANRGLLRFMTVENRGMRREWTLGSYMDGRDHYTYTDKA